MSNHRHQTYVRRTLLYERIDREFQELYALEWSCFVQAERMEDILYKRLFEQHHREIRSLCGTTANPQISEFRKYGPRPIPNPVRT